MRTALFPDFPFGVMLFEFLLILLSSCWGVLRTRCFITQRIWLSGVFLVFGSVICLLASIVMHKDIIRVEVGPSRNLFFWLMIVSPLSIIAGFIYYQNTAMKSVEAWIESNVNPKTFAVDWPQLEYSTSKASVFSGVTMFLFGALGTISFYLYQNPNTLKDFLAPIITPMLVAVVVHMYFKRIGFDLCVIWNLWTQKKHPPSAFLLKDIKGIDAARREHWLGQYLAQPEFRRRPKSSKKKRNR